MNFFTALAIFRIIMPSVDITVLPMISTTYVIDSGVVVPWRQTRWEGRSESLIENTTLQHSLGTPRVDTTIYYMRLDASANPVKFTSLPNEDPIQNGTEFLYAGNVLTQRKQYQNGIVIYTTQFQYAAGGKLGQVATSDSIGPFNTTNYTYAGDRISEIEAISRSGYSRIKYTYAGTDTISSQDYDSGGTASAFRIDYILKDGKIVKENDYHSGDLIGFTIHDYPSTTAIARSAGCKGSASACDGSGAGLGAGFGIGLNAGLAPNPRDALGRRKPYLTEAGVPVGWRNARYR